VIYLSIVFISKKCNSVLSIELNSEIIKINDNDKIAEEKIQLKKKREKLDKVLNA
jgi:hypothetical protein